MLAATLDEGSCINFREMAFIENTLYFIPEDDGNLESDDFSKLQSTTTVIRNMNDQVLFVDKRRPPVFEDMPDADQHANPQTRLIIYMYKDSEAGGMAVTLSVKHEKMSTLSCKDKSISFKEMDPPEYIDGTKSDLIFFLRSVPGHDKMQFESSLYKRYFLACEKEDDFYKLILKEKSENGDKSWSSEGECGKDVCPNRVFSQGREKRDSFLNRSRIMLAAILEEGSCINFREIAFIDNTLYFTPEDDGNLKSDDFGKKRSKICVIRDMNDQVLLVIGRERPPVFEDMPDADQHANPQTRLIIHSYIDWHSRGKAVTLSVKHEKMSILSCKDKGISFKEMDPPEYIDGTKSDFIFFLRSVPGHNKVQFESSMHEGHFLACEKEGDFFKLTLKKKDENGDKSVMFTVTSLPQS